VGATTLNNPPFPETVARSDKVISHYGMWRKAKEKTEPASISNYFFDRVGVGFTLRRK
jgi:hypothetical protein